MDSGIPPALVGTWSQGSSWGSLVDSAGNAAGPFTSSGFAYRFSADGTYEFVGSMSVGGSGESVFERGTVEIAGYQLTLYPSEGAFRQPDGSTTARDLTPRSYGWQVGLDFIGSVTLTLMQPNGGMDTYYRE